MLGSGLLAMLCAGMAWVANLHINLTPSIPRRLYQATPQSPSRHDVVLACLPQPFAALASERGYVAAGACPGHLMPVGKVVYGVPGDTVEITTRGIRVNGRLLPQSRALSQDDQHRKLPHVPEGTIVLDSNHWWLDAPHARSLGSRYVGPFPRQAILTTLRPLWLVAGDTRR